MRVFFVGVGPRRRGLGSLLLVAAFGLWLLGVGRILGWWTPFSGRWGEYVLASTLPVESSRALPVFSWDGWDVRKVSQPQEWLAAQMPFLSASRAEPAVPTLGNPLEEEEEPVPPPGPEGQPEGSSGPPSPSLPEVGQAEEVRVFVYTTHNAESYVPDYGVAKVAPGSAGGVTRVAAVLAAALEEQGVRTVLSTAVHDYPDFRWSYVKAESTVKAALARYPRLSLIVDVHRDAGQNRPVTAAVEGQTVAQILLVVGSDRRLAHPNWQENLAFAKKVEAKMNELFPGLCAGTRVQDGRYNQHLHPRAILVEVGNHLNTLAEAEASARLLARVLKEVL